MLQTKRKDVSVSNYVISLFFLPHCVSYQVWSVVRIFIWPKDLLLSVGTKSTIPARHDRSMSVPSGSQSDSPQCRRVVWMGESWLFIFVLNAVSAIFDFFIKVDWGE